MLFYFACEAAGATSTRRSPRPLFFEASGWHNSGATRRENAEVCLRLATSLRGAKRRSNPIFAFTAARMDCFANARNDGIKPSGCLKSEAGVSTAQSSYAGLTRVSIGLRETLLEADGLPGRCPAMTRLSRQHAIEKLPHLAVEKFHVGGNRAAGGGVAGDGAGADRHQLHAYDILRGFLRFEFGVEQILGAGEDQRLRFDRGERLRGVAVESGRGADVVALIGPGLVNPVVGVEGLQRRGLLRLHPGQGVHAVLELRRIQIRRARRE